MCRHSYFAYWTSSGLCKVCHTFHRRVWYRALSLRYARAMRVCDVRASSSPLGYLCAKFRFCCALHCWASPWRKIAYSITQSLSLTCPAYWMRPEPKLSLRNKSNRQNRSSLAAHAHYIHSWACLTTKCHRGTVTPHLSISTISVSNPTPYAILSVASTAHPHTLVNMHHHRQHSSAALL